MIKLIYFVYFGTLIGIVFGFAYADSYPYKKSGFAFSNDGGSMSDSELAADSTGFIKSRVKTQGDKQNAGGDAGSYHNLENVSNGHDVHHVKKGSSADNVKRTQGENFENDKSHTRKHIKSGFQNSYHKDENGSKSSYYEDSDDRGEKLVFDKKQGMHGDSNNMDYSEGLKKGVIYDKLDNRRGGYDNRGSQDYHHLMAEDQGKRHGYRDDYRGGLADRFSSYDDDSNRRYSDYDRWYRPSSSYVNYRQPTIAPYNQISSSAYNRFSPRNSDDGYFSHHKITIYDDPRDYIGDRRRSDYIAETHTDYAGRKRYHSPILDFRPSPLYPYSRY